jgi:hypothetical protein
MRRGILLGTFRFNGVFLGVGSQVITAAFNKNKNSGRSVIR